MQKPEIFVGKIELNSSLGPALRIGVEEIPAPAMPQCLCPSTLSQKGTWELLGKERLPNALEPQRGNPKGIPVAAETPCIDAVPSTTVHNVPQTYSTHSLCH